MNHQSRKCCLLIPLLLLTSAFGQSQAPAMRVRHVVTTLVEQFETVFYAKSDLIAGSSGTVLAPKTADMLRVPFAELLGAFEQLEPSSTAKILSSSEAIFLAAGQFRPPVGLGGVQSTYCYVLLLNKDVGELGEIFKSRSRLSFQDRTIWHWSAPPQEGHPETYEFYLTEVNALYLILSNDMQKLTTTANALAAVSPPDSRLSPRLNYLQQQEYWGYHKATRGANNEGTLASGCALTFVVDLKHKAGILRVYSDICKPNSIEAIHEKLHTLRKVDPEYWEATIQLRTSEESREELFYIMSSFGLGIYL